MRLQHIPVHPKLKGYVEKIWVFETTERIPDEDMKLIVPNGLVKIVIPFRNGLHGKMEGWELLSKESRMTLIGICDKPSIVDVEKDGPSGTIGVEFSPMGVYRFFNIRQSEIRNTIHLLTDVLGKTSAEIEEKIASAENIEQKLAILQQFLSGLFKNNEDNVFEHCIKRITGSNGTVTIKQLEAETGYSSRWLNMKFDEKIGVSPKNLCSIMRFHTTYQALAFNTGHNFTDLYYDQAHFIKDFKRFTGFSPAKFEKQVNEFDKIFYR